MVNTKATFQILLSIYFIFNILCNVIFRRPTTVVGVSRDTPGMYGQTLKIGDEKDAKKRREKKTRKKDAKERGEKKKQKKDAKKDAKEDAKKDTKKDTQEDAK